MAASVTTYFKDSDYFAVKDFQPIRKWLETLPWRAKPRLPCERALNK